MPEVARISAFEAHAALATSTATVAAGVTMAVRRVRVMLNVRGHPDDRALERALAERFGVSLALAPNTAAGAGATRILWLGPDERLLVSEHPVVELPALIGNGTVTDVSHGRAALRVSGPQVRAALAKGCPLDLHPREFPPDRCAQTAIARVSVILDHVRPDVFDLYCPRSYAGSFWHWLSDACAEYGRGIAPPA